MVEGGYRDLILVLGGARSGKSRWAQGHVEGCSRAPLYIATAEVSDDEMAERIRLHQEARGARWRLIEEPLELERAIRSAPPEVDGILIDCLTVWLSNVLLKKGEDAVPAYEARLMQALEERSCLVAAVANEVGMSVVPAHPLGRLFRDLAGWLNQRVAAAADRVVLTVAGLPLVLKADGKAAAPPPFGLGDR
ncbi:Bifunctional adenosylcobalamin biosynthesis protein CobP [uncultured Desulfatiglans sp.]|uniref:Adenosylcobinamide kinase n=1 Tax=Uncultured Desulfatiglans sp. TaxID=1748965 RepID=A0A653ADF6_UNCDX|nr:Bifunctional adenosylcobalamin biosynthesis protein CobP [uncultured Desulfatiglans sp.]